MSFLTIFSAPKPFTDAHINTIQRNAIQSWTRLGAQVEVLLMGAEPGMAETASEFGVRHLPEVACEDGLPLIGGMFDLARRESDAPVLAMVNADILLMPDFLEAARRAQAQYAPFVLVGQRWDLDVTAALDFSPGWEERLRADARQSGHLHKQAGSDYFLYSRQAFSEVPGFTVGRAGWDNAMLYQAAHQPWHTLDATADIMVVHQNHDYRHLPGGQIHYKHPASKKNVALAGGEHRMYDLLDLRYRLVNGEMRRIRPSWVRFVRALERILQPRGEISGLRGRLFRGVRRYRKRL